MTRSAMTYVWRTPGYSRYNGETNVAKSWINEEVQVEAFNVYKNWDV